MIISISDQYIGEVIASKSPILQYGDKQYYLEVVSDGNEEENIEQIDEPNAELSA